MERKMQRISHVLGRLLLEFQPYWTPEKSNHKTQISFVSFSLELSVARSVTAVSSGACSECLYGGDCVWNKHTFTQGVGRLLIEHLLCVPKSPQMSPNHHHPQKHTGVQYFRVSGQMVTSQSTWMGWAELCCHQCSVQTTAAFGSCRCSEASNLQPAQIT